MNMLKQILFTLATICITSTVFGQANPFINVLPDNSGIVYNGGTLDILVTIGNTGPTSAIPQAKLRPIIQVPTSVTFLPNAQQTGLPAGWTILSNTGAQLRLCNSTDAIPVNTSRIIILKVQGVAVSPPQTFSGNINFGNGTTCAAGPSVTGDQITDNSATSTIEVTAGIPLPSILNNFSVKTNNCTAHLTWSTSSETNTEKFEIEKSETITIDWKTIGSVHARGNTSTNWSYDFNDDRSLESNKVVLYRLKMIDIDGMFTYSPVLNAIPQCDEKYLSVFPNPVANGDLYINLVGIETVEANLTSVTGQFVKQINLKNGMNSLDVSDLSNGVYILNTRSSKGISQNVKVTIQK